MAYAPCSLCSQRFLGKAAHVYPALVNGRDFERAKLRLCPSCTTDYERSVLSRCAEVRPEDGGQPELSALCISCGAELDDTRRAVFVTTYMPGEERKDYFAEAHPECFGTTSLRLGLPS